MAEFAAELDELRAVRAFVRQTWADMDEDDLAELLLITHELASNAILHAGTSYRVVLVATPEGVRIEVHDGSRELPRRQSADRSSESGRGLRLVELLSRSWGVEPGDDGKAVWAEIARSSVAEKPTG